jgi:hypothetical protein
MIPASCFGEDSGPNFEVLVSLSKDREGVHVGGPTDGLLEGS